LNLSYPESPRRSILLKGELSKSASKIDELDKEHGQSSKLLLDQGKCLDDIARKVDELSARAIELSTAMEKLSAEVEKSQKTISPSQR
jgi:uncharacterized coiled-coil DUF342 family protein